MSHRVTIVTLIRISLTARTADGAYLNSLYADAPLDLPVHIKDQLEMGLLDLLKTRVHDLAYADVTHDEIAWAEL